MNERIRKLANRSYDQAREQCAKVEHKITDTDPLFCGFAMNEMYKITVSDCVQTLVDHGYTDAATVLTKEMTHV